MTRLFVSVLSGMIVLFAAQICLSFLTPPALTPNPISVPPVLLSNALTTGMLVVLAWRMSSLPVQRAMALFAVWGGIQTLSLIELFLFDIGVTRSQIVGLIFYNAALAAAAAAFMGWIAPRRESATTTMPVEARAVRLALAPPVYLTCYFVAGAMAWPFVAAYYQARPMPALGPLVSLQLFRGLGFGAIVLLIVRVCDGSRRERTLIAALTLAILGGAAPLVMPNPLMPQAIRMVHLFEVVPSIFVFGTITALVLTRRSRVSTQP